MTSDRIRCCITGCGRTYKRTPTFGPGEVVICGRHWRMGSEVWRRRRTKLLRRYRHRPSDRLAELIQILFRRIRAEAEAASAGRVTGTGLNTFLERL